MRVTLRFDENKTIDLELIHGKRGPALKVTEKALINGRIQERGPIWFEEQLMESAAETILHMLEKARSLIPPPTGTPSTP